MVAELYERVHTADEEGRLHVGWRRGVYPTQATAEEALRAEELFVALEGTELVGTAIINRTQPECYGQGNWTEAAEPEEVMVLHTLAIDPCCSARGYGQAMVVFYEAYAAAQGCKWLRLDTQVGNDRARHLYRRLGYREAGVVPCNFHRLGEVQLLLLEKQAGCR